MSGVIGKTGNLVSKIAEISGSDQVKARGDEVEFEIFLRSSSSVQN